MKHVIIVGAGFAGVRTALDLAKKDLKDLKITLINKTKYHTFHADLYEVATAVLVRERRIDFHELDHTTNIQLKDIFSGTKVETFQDTLLSADPQKQTITTSSSTMDYDYLVLALGSTTHYFGIPGAEEFSHPLKTTEDAVNIRNDIEEVVLRSNTPVTIAIAGGGFTGVELAGELVNYLQNLSTVFKRPLGKVVIVESSRDILGGMPKWAKDRAKKRLKKLGIHTESNSHILKVQKDRLLCQDNKFIEYDYLVWATGVKGASLDGAIKEVELSKKQQLVVSPDLSLIGFPNIFAPGDIAYLTDPKSKTQLPSTAVSAYRQGALVAKNIALSLKSHNTLDFTPEPPIFVVPIGGKYGLANLLGLHLSGFPVWVLKRFISLRYLLSILPISKSFNLWRKGVTIYLKND